MNTQSALEQLEALNKTHEEKVADLKKQAAKELLTIISDLKDKLKAAESQYLELTGKEAASVEDATETGSRIHLTKDEYKVLASKITGILKGSNGVKITDIFSQCVNERVKETHVRKALNSIAGLKKKGKLAAMVYSL